MVKESQPHLDALVAARVLREVSDGEYAFRHALMHEAVYSTLLRRERRLGHLAVAELLVGKFAGTPQFDAYVGEVAYHYMRAEVWPQALIYARMAGEAAHARYAQREAIEDFSRALTAVRQMGQDPDPALLRQRGMCFEAVGDFDGAQADFVAALLAARAIGDRDAEWQILLDLGLLWSGRDYAHAGGFFDEALALARASGVPSALAHSLNRVGNWRLNQGQPLEALKLHEEALGLFDSLQDQSGLANTFDLVGMASFLSGDAVAGMAYLERAVTLFRELDDKAGLVSSLSTLTLRGTNCFTDTLAPVAPASAVIREGEAALALARAIQHRTNEAFILIALGAAEGATGAYPRGLAQAHAGLALAEEIGHTQWQTLGHCALGALYLDLSADEQAQAHLLRARELAQVTRSVYWFHMTSGWLARAYLRAGTPAGREAARAVLAATNPDAELPRAVGQRVVWSALAELALADADPALALRRVDALLELLPHPDPRGAAAIPRLARLKAEALRRLGQLEAARALLEAARAEARQQGTAAELARLEAALRQVMQDAGSPHAPTGG